MECLNWQRLGFFWLIGDGMLIGDDWLGLSAMECSSAMIGLGYRRQKAQIDDGWVSFGLSATECSLATVAWVIGNGMLIDNGRLGLSATESSNR